MIYIFILRLRRLCVEGIQSERVRTYLSSVAGDLFCEVVQRLESTLDMFAWVTRRSLPSLEKLKDLFPSLERPANLCLQSKITDLILSFQIPCGSMDTLFASRIFSVYAWLSELTYFRFFSGILLILSANGNICHSIHRQ